MGAAEDQARGRLHSEPEPCASMLHRSAGNAEAVCKGDEVFLDLGRTVAAFASGYRKDRRTVQSQRRLVLRHMYMYLCDGIDGLGG